MAPTEQDGDTAAGDICGISVERLRDLKHAGLKPHYRGDSGQGAPHTALGHIYIQKSSCCAAIMLQTFQWQPVVGAGEGGAADAKHLLRPH